MKHGYIVAGLLTKTNQIITQVHVGHDELLG